MCTHPIGKNMMWPLFAMGPSCYLNGKSVRDHPCVSIVSMCADIISDAIYIVHHITSYYISYVSATFRHIVLQ